MEDALLVCRKAGEDSNGDNYAHLLLLLSQKLMSLFEVLSLCKIALSCNTCISNKRDRRVSLQYPNEKKRVKNVMRGGVFLMKLKMFGELMKHLLSSLFDIFSQLKQKLRSKQRQQYI